MRRWAGDKQLLGLILKKNGMNFSNCQCLSNKVVCPRNTRYDHSRYEMHITSNHAMVVVIHFFSEKGIFIDFKLFMAHYSPDRPAWPAQTSWAGPGR